VKAVLTAPQVPAAVLALLLVAVPAGSPAQVLGVLAALQQAGLLHSRMTPYQ